MKSILVTGASGFVGSRLVKKLNQLKKYNVTTTDKVGKPDLVGDLADKVFVSKFRTFDIVIHCAAVQYVTKNKPLFFQKKWFYQNNISAIKNLTSRFKNCKTYFIHIGTSMQYYQNNSPIYSINSAMGEQGLYSWSKLEAQKIVNQRMNNSATIIPCIVGGPGREGLFKGFVNSLNRFGIGIIPGKGRFKTSMVHVDDLVGLIILAVEKKPTGYFNAAASDALSIMEWITYISKILKIKKPNLFFIPLYFLKIISRLTVYRLLAKEQLIMLSMSHLIDISESLAIGWKPKKTTKDIINDITLSITKKKRTK